MSELPKTYDPSTVEDKWYKYWLDQKFFSSKPNPEKEPYTIVIPPPNVTGILHMGHMLNNTIQDVLIRKARMQGYEALWVPGTDHASIATEAKVVNMLKEQHGVTKQEVGREKFLEHAWEWKEKYGGIILEQLKKLGASCDWDRTRFTMEPEMNKAVTKIFVDLYKKGYIYRDYRMGNWDPKGKTALADDEVIHKESTANFYYVAYKIADSEDTLTIATTRPETIMADTAICVNPNDERFQHLIGKKAIVPLVNREIPIIADEYVDMELGTGCLKVTPAHDPNDYEIGKRHNLPVIDLLNPDGTLNEKAEFFVGEDRAKARKLVAKKLDELGQLVKVEELTHSVGYSERTNAVVEPRITMQWYVKMEELTKPALENVMNDNIQFHPAKFKNTYRHWMENVRDWCISRQLWWGHRIPAWYLPNGEFVVAHTVEEALELAKEIDTSLTVDQLQQDEDVLDTWFSSGLWPISVFDGLTNPNNEDINYYYPTNVLVTAPEILFFWVARMVIYGYEYFGEKPFKDVYLTGIVRDKQRRKMSKSLGNSPDALKLIEQYGADGVRTGMLFSSPAGNDLLFDEKLCEQGSRFNNKMWNAFRLVKGWEVDANLDGSKNQIAISWFKAKFQDALAKIEDHFSKFRLSDALNTMYILAWDDFCSWYLEMIKPEYGKPIDKDTYEATIGFLDDLMRLIHPFMPFITEEIWQYITKREDGESICVADYPKQTDYDKEILAKAEVIFTVISQVRNVRNEKQISPNTALELLINTDNQALFHEFEAIIKKLANVSDIQFVSEKPEGTASFVHQTHECFVPVAGQINVEKEIEKIQSEIKRKTNLKIGAEKKLANERFVANAPEQVVATERKKLEDAINSLKVLEENLKVLEAQA
ncbi:MAG: valine--tRNA ligase [Flammeovirgaceae bacterium]